MTSTNPQDILVDGVSTKLLHDSMIAAGVSERRALEFIGHIYVGASGGHPPAPFEFDTQVAQEVPECAPEYARQFVHADWVDGEDRVQAGTTPDEQGFNLRFHSIENELDRIAAEFQKMGGCVADLRRELFGVLEELEAKITDLQNQIHELADEDAGGGGVLPGSVGGFGRDFMGVTNFNNRTYWLLNDHGRIRMIDMSNQPGAVGPAVNPAPGGVIIDVDPAAGGVVRPGDTVLPVDELLDVMTDFGTRLDRDPAVRSALVGGASVGSFTERFGATEIISESTGRVRFGRMLGGIDRDTVLRDTEAVVDAAADRVLTGSSPEARTALINGLVNPRAAGRTGDALRALNLRLMTTVTDAHARDLQRAGFATIGSIADASVDAVMTRLTPNQMNRAEVRRIVTAARLLLAADRMRQN
jgi:hypothetical protein